LLDEHGRREVVAFLFPGDILCAGLSWNWASATALSCCELRAFQIRNFMSTVERDAESAAAILKTLEFQLHSMAQHLARVSKTDARARLWWFIRWLSGQAGGASSFKLPPRADIADFLGTAPETISRLLQSMEDEGVIRRSSDRGCKILVNVSR
jgi:CRP-like cAMP-binding protein